LIVKTELSTLRVDSSILPNNGHYTKEKESYKMLNRLAVEKQTKDVTVVREGNSYEFIIRKGSK
jgi:hypothetical protein